MICYLLLFHFNIISSSIDTVWVINNICRFSGLVKLREFVGSPKIRNIEVNLRQADPDSYRQVLSEMKSKEIRNLIVDTRPEHMHHFLRMVSLCKIHFLYVPRGL